MHRNPKKILLNNYPVLLFPLVLFTLIIISCKTAGFSIVETFSSLPESFYWLPRANNILANSLNGEEALAYIYRTLFISLLLSVLIEMKTKTSEYPFAERINKAVFLLMLTGCISILGIQTFSHCGNLLSNLSNHTGQTVHQKNENLKGAVYGFSKFCKEKLDGKFRGKYISTDNSRREEMILTYFLLPIDITDTTDYPEKCYVISHKGSPLSDELKNNGTLHHYSDDYTFIVSGGKQG